MPPRRTQGPEQGPPEATRERLAASRVAGELAVNQLIDEESRAKLHGMLDETLDQLNINPSFVKGFRVSQWDGMIKNNQGEMEIKKLRGLSLVAEARDFTPSWPPVTRVESIVAPPSERKESTGSYERCVILPDPQIGFLRYRDGSMEAIHDTSAIDIALQIIQDVKPNKVVCLGDYLDLAEWSKYEQSPEFAATTQAAIEYGHRLLSTIRQMLPDAEIVVLEGNHDRRLERTIKNNAMHAFGLRRAADTTNWPVLSLPYLMAFDQLNVNYVEGYPAGRYWINHRLQAKHGHIVRSGGSTAKVIADDERVSTVFGHVHRIETHFKTTNTYEGGKTNCAFTPGTLARIDGTVPSVKGSQDLNGRPVRNFENWQQGIAVVDYQPGDGPFHYQQIYINTFGQYETLHGGKIYLPRDEQV